MAPSDPNRPFHLELNESGYGFQAAVVNSLREHASSQWLVETTELPVAYRGMSIHIDVLAWLHHHYLFVGECKRVNPAFGSWFFVRSPFTVRRRPIDVVWFEKLHGGQPGTTMSNASTIVIESDVAHDDRPWQIGLDVKTDAKAIAPAKAAASAML